MENQSVVLKIYDYSYNYMCASDEIGEPDSWDDEEYDDEKLLQMKENWTNALNEIHHATTIPINVIKAYYDDKESLKEFRSNGDCYHIDIFFRYLWHYETFEDFVRAANDISYFHSAQARDDAGMYIFGFDNEKVLKYINNNITFFEKQTSNAW